VSRRPTILQAKFSTWLGWSQPFLHRFAEGVRRHYRVAVLCQRIENAERFPVESYVCAGSQSLTRPSSASVVAAYLRAAVSPSLIHAHFGWSGIRVLLLRELLGVPLVTTFGGKDVCAQMASERYELLYSLLLERSSRLVCVSEDLRRRLEQAGADPRRLRTIRRGTDTELFEYRCREEPAAGDPLRLLMIGRLAEKKGHLHLFRAMARLASRNVGTSLRILGTGEHEARLRQEAEKMGIASCVEWLRPCESEGVVGQLHWAHVFVHPSVTAADGDREGIPNVAVEAASTGLPVVGTHHGGIPEAVEDGVTGILVAERDDAALAEALARLAQNPAMRHRMGEAGARRVRERFSMRAQIAEYVDLYEELRTDPDARSVPSLPPEFATECARVFEPRLTRENLFVARYVAAALERNRDPRGPWDREEDAVWPLRRRMLLAAELTRGWGLTRRVLKSLLGPMRESLLERWARRVDARVAREQLVLDARVGWALRGGGRLEWEGTPAARRAASFVLRARIGDSRSGWASP
jgi:colanic acid/amylovoran biosynthesis glycosyltransferase